MNCIREAIDYSRHEGRADALGLVHHHPRQHGARLTGEPRVRQ